jgi:hypothetical protein
VFFLLKVSILFSYHKCFFFCRISFLVFSRFLLSQVSLFSSQSRRTNSRRTKSPTSRKDRDFGDLLLSKGRSIFLSFALQRKKKTDFNKIGWKDDSSLIFSISFSS